MGKQETELSSRSNQASHAWKLLIEIGPNVLLQKISVNFYLFELKFSTTKDFCMIYGSMVFRYFWRESGVTSLKSNL